MVALGGLAQPRPLLVHHLLLLVVVVEVLVFLWFLRRQVRVVLAVLGVGPTVVDT